MTFNANKSVDIKTVSVDTSPDKTARIMNYINTVKNPYSFRVGDTPVNVRYGGSGTIQGLFTSYVRGKYTGKNEGSML